MKKRQAPPVVSRVDVATVESTAAATLESKHLRMRMSQANEHVSSTAPALPPLGVCLDVPSLRGGRALQAFLVDQLKRLAIRRLHRTLPGECWLLRMYLIGEQTTENVMNEDWVGQPPQWLAPCMSQHLQDERQHAAAFSKALHVRGVSITTEELTPDWLSRRKIRLWRRLAHRHNAYFNHGLLVPAYAIGLCAEQMAMRVLRRHCEVIGQDHPLHPLLARVLADEARHVQLCRDSLLRLVAQEEETHLASLLDEVRANEASWGVTGAVAMYALGWIYWLRARWA